MEKNRSTEFIWIVLVFLFILFLFPGIGSKPLGSQESTRTEITSLMTAIEKKFSELKAEGAGKSTPEELSKIEEYLTLAKKSLAAGNEEQAYFEITLGKACLKLLDSRRELNRSLQEYESIKNSVNP